jgi:hypothetical protein
MKIILSRKGFDSANGGYPSPLLPDGRLVSLPIPEGEPHGNPILYSDLYLDRGKTYYDLMWDLFPRPRLRHHNGWHHFTPNTPCHLDPDICAGVLGRPRSWKPLFGQSGAAQTHLESQDVKPGDLFLFFGWFRETTANGRRFARPEVDPGRHIIYGYLQVGRVRKVSERTKTPRWMAYHPHANPPFQTNNTFYEAAKYLSWDNTIRGAGVFRFGDHLVLTDKGRSRTKWRLPDCFRKVNITYHSQQSWADGYFQSAAIGQEFVIEETPEVEEWAKDLITESTIQ